MKPTEIGFYIIEIVCFKDAQNQNSCPNKLNYVSVRNPDGGTKVMVNYRSPVDTSAVTQAQMDKVLIGLKMKGDGNAMKGRNKELGTRASHLKEL